MSAWGPPPSSRGLALTLAMLLAVLGCGLDLLLPYSNGYREYEERNLVAVPGGVVNAAGGALILSRTDLSMDAVV